MDSDSDAPLVNSGRFMALSRDSDGSDEDVGAEPARSQSGKRLRVTRRDRARASPGNTFTRDPSSVSGALEFDLTQLDSELEGPMPPAEALVEPTRESESDTESVRVVPRRRLVLQFARDEDSNNGSGDEHQRSEPVEEELNEDLLFTPQTRAMSNGFEGLDEVSLGEVFEVRAQVMKTVPNFMKGVFRGGLKMSLEEILKGRARSDSVKEIRGWKLFFLLPRLLLFRPPRGGLVPKARLQERVSMFSAGDWLTLLDTSLEASVTGTTARCRRRRGKQDTIQARAARALGLVHMGELSNARQALEGDALAPGTEKTWKALTDEERRPPGVREPLDPFVAEETPQFLSTWTLISCLRICGILGEVQQGDRLA